MDDQVLRHDGQLPNLLTEQQFAGDQTRQWYDWIYRRVEQNPPYDQLVSGIVLATSREPGQAYKEYCEQTTSYLRRSDPQDFSTRNSMPHFWTAPAKQSAEGHGQRFRIRSLACG